MSATEPRLPDGDKSAHSLHRLVRKPRHKWFSAPERQWENGWLGPHETIEAAVIECANNYEGPIFVGQGHKLSKAELEDFGSEYDWEVDTENAIEVRLPNEKVSEAAGRKG